MSRLDLILIFVLQFEAGVSREFIYRYNSPGHDVTLSCGNASVSDTTCSSVSWLYSREPSLILVEVKEGKVQKSSARAARLSLGSDCSLVINNITAEDFGRFTCRQGRNTDLDAHVHLSLLTISPSPPDADAERDGDVTLVCTLLRQNEFGSCRENSIRWVDDTGAVLDGEGVGYKFLGQSDCASSFIVKRQSGNNRTYTCQFIDRGNNVKVETDYTPVFSGDKRDDQAEKSKPDGPLSSIMLALRITGLILMIVITVLVIRDRMKTKSCDNDNNVQKDDDEVTYENVEAGPATVRLH